MPLDPTTQNIIISSVSGLIAGGIVSILAPWTHWGIEKKRKKLEARRKIIDACKTHFEKCNFNSGFLNNHIYSSLKPEFTKELVSKMESEAINIQMGNGRSSGVYNFKAEILDEVARIEREWGLA